MMEAQYLIEGHRIPLQVAYSLYWRSLHLLRIVPAFELAIIGAESFVFQFAVQKFKDLRYTEL